MRLIVFIITGLLLATPPLAAEDSYNEGPRAGWMMDPAKGCRVWTTSYRKERSAAVKWSGVCDQGFATGRGTAAYEDGNGGSTGKMDGLFQQGIFVGKERINVKLEPLPYDQVMAYLGDDPKTGAGLFLIQGFYRDASFRLCTPTKTNLFIVGSRLLDITDDESVKEQMKRAVAIYQQYCPARGSLELTVVPEKFTMEANPKDKSYLAPSQAIANSHFQRKGDYINLGNYRNVPALAAADAKRKAEELARTATEREKEELKRNESRRAFDMFNKAWKVDVWATTTQLHDNPFKYQGKVVGLRVGLDRVITPTLGRIYSQRTNTNALLKDMPKGFFDNGRRAVLAVRVDGTGAYEMPDTYPNHRRDLIGLTFLGGDMCADNTCFDYFYWSIGESDFKWGEDQSKYLPERNKPPAGEAQL